MKHSRIPRVATLSTIAFLSILLFSQSTDLGERGDERWRDIWDASEVDTARDVSYLTEDEKDVILWMNLARTRPKDFARLYAAPFLGFFKGKLMSVPGMIDVRTTEGKRPAQELVTFLQKAKAAPPLRPSKGISKAAAAHASDQAKTGATGHTGKDGSSPFDRMNRFGEWQSKAGENVAYGNGAGFMIVMQLMIDDGVSSRGHRKNIMEPGFGVTGVGIDGHPEYGAVCVIDYAADYDEK